MLIGKIYETVLRPQGRQIFRARAKVRRGICTLDSLNRWLGKLGPITMRQSSMAEGKENTFR